jgi:hypothetical protein
VIQFKQVGFPDFACKNIIYPVMFVFQITNCDFGRKPLLADQET